MSYDIDSPALVGSIASKDPSLTYYIIIYGHTRYTAKVSFSRDHIKDVAGPCLRGLAGKDIFTQKPRRC